MNIKKHNNIIVPLRFRSAAELRDLLSQIRGRAVVVELWLDQVWQDEVFLAELPSILRAFPYHYLAVCKALAERGTFLGTPLDRVDTLLRFLAAGGHWADLDITQNFPEVIKKIPAERLILSFHDFVGGDLDLHKIFTQAQEFSPFIYKFAVTVNDKKSRDDFLLFVRNFPASLHGIFTTMGVFGLTGREEIEKTEKSWGNFYALSADYSTAVGQKPLPRNRE